MTDNAMKMTTSTPWHLWAVGVVALLWNGYGGYDYVMTQTDNAAYMAQFTAEQVRVHAAKASSRCTPRLSFAPLADRRCVELASRDGPTSKLDE